MEKKAFEKPTLEIYMFEDDIITTSGGKQDWTDDYIIPNN